MRKVYEYVNKVEAELVVVSKSGSTKYKFKFTGGVMDPKNKIHAKHTTDNPIMQRVLETSPYFGKSVRLVAAFDTPETREPVLIKKAVVAPVETTKPATATDTTKPGKGNGRGNGRGNGKGNKTVPEEGEPNPGIEKPEEPKVRIIEDVTDAGAAASILLSEGVVDDPTKISSLDGVLKVAKENNIFFPNLK